MTREEIKNLAYNRKWIASDAYNEDNPLVSLWLDDLYELMQQLGWHPASELPPVDKETGLSDEVIAIQDRFSEGERVIYTRIVGSGWKHDNIKRWCHLPRKD